jgi:hypothetical protein
MSEATYYLRMEGVNLANFVYDTQDLSTVRGGGLLLLDAVDRVEGKLKEFIDNGSVKAVSTGASSGLFEFRAASDDSAKKVRKQVEDFLNTDVQLKHATFVVDTWPSGGDEKFAEDKEQLIALNRWRQMRSPTVAVPASVSGCVSPCGTDLVRPAATETEMRNKKGERVCQSVWQRRKYGIEEKRGKLYNKLTGLPENARFTEHLSELTEDASRGSINHKMAVIYADGNGFGKLQSDFTKSELTSFDKDIKEKRKLFLGKLLEQMDEDPRGWMTLGDPVAYRLETLLWGGDEFMLVVPAWKGWETLQLFYTMSETWKFGNEELTHSAGLVFCHHNAPIHRIKALAHDLAEVCKNADVIGKKGNYFTYQVLESFDCITGDVAAFLRKKSIGDSACPMILAGSDMPGIAGNVSKIKNDGEFARGRLHSIVTKLRTGDEEGSAEEIRKIYAACGEGTGEIFRNLESQLHGQNSWLHLADLFDYVAVKEAEDDAKN